MREIRRRKEEEIRSFGLLFAVALLLFMYSLYINPFIHSTDKCRGLTTVQYQALIKHWGGTKSFRHYRSVADQAVWEKHK